MPSGGPSEGRTPQFEKHCSSRHAHVRALDSLIYHPEKVGCYVGSDVRKLTSDKDHLFCQPVQFLPFHKNPPHQPGHQQEQLGGLGQKV